ncbi:O-antigen ligase family protein [Candidatus Pelagibacter sp. Uisw_130]|uniref:O-antigen ligase family protein n=1 Tax=Candidatus Pelagibacter sp. Uisw_130 TaxID=3230989 RepID=UPI0039EB3369
MILRKDSLRNLFLIILAITVSFNGSINPLLIQTSSVSFIFFFILCLKNNKVLERINENYRDNKIFFIFYFIYIGYLIFQIIPLPLNLIEIIAPNNYNLYTSIKIDKELWSLSIDPSNSYFKILNCISFFIIFLVFPTLFNRDKYLMKFLFFVCILGFCHAIFATYWMLLGNPSNFLIQKVHYLRASTGLYVNRAVFGTFLFLTAFSGLYYIVVFFLKNQITNFNFLQQIKSKIFFIRIFILFLSLGILSTWSRVANFSYILILLSFLFYSKINFKKYINPLSIIIIFILIFDVFVMTLFFGNARLIERLVEVSIVKDYIRLDLHSFGLVQFKNFWLFGYGNGAFEQIFKLFYILPETIPNDYLARHVHNDGIELLGEVGVVGVSIFAIITIIYFKKLLNNINEKKQFARFILLSLLVFILFIQSIVDYSLQIPGIQVLLITIFSMGLINFTRNDS